MQHRSSTFLFLLLSLHGLAAFASNLLNKIELPVRPRSLDDLLHREAWVVVDKEQDASKRAEPLDRRMSVTRATATNASTFDEQAFNQSATVACMNAVSNYSEAVNPSGMVACYNIAFYDNSTGVFQTDVRLYQKSDPTGNFVGVAPSDYSMSFSIPEATLSAPLAVMSGPMTSTNATGQFLAGFQNIGQMSKSLVFSKLTEADLRVLMIPAISMAVVNPTLGTASNTSLSSDTISYVAGQLAQTGATPTNITEPEAKALASPIISSASAFVLPGTRIMVFPTGLIITCAWTGIFALAVGYGTIGRYRFRQHYRHRIQRTQTKEAAPGSK